MHRGAEPRISSPAQSGARASRAVACASPRRGPTSAAAPQPVLITRRACLRWRRAGVHPSRARVRARRGWGGTRAQPSRSSPPGAAAWRSGGTGAVGFARWLRKEGGVCSNWRSEAEGNGLFGSLRRVAAWMGSFVLWQPGERAERAPKRQGGEGGASRRMVCRSHLGAARLLRALRRAKDQKPAVAGIQNRKR